MRIVQTKFHKLRFTSLLMLLLFALFLMRVSFACAKAERCAPFDGIVNANTNICEQDTTGELNK